MRRMKTQAILTMPSSPCLQTTSRDGGLRGQYWSIGKCKRRDFYRTLTRRMHESGALRFFYLKLDDRLLAQEYCFEYDGVVFLLQEGFDSSLSKDNIGNALRSHVFRVPDC